MIPKHIHQTWKNAAMDAPLKDYQNSWRQHNPSFSYSFYDDLNCVDFITQFYPEYVIPYSRLQTGVQKADFFRYLIVFHYGGIYADIDMECYKSFDCFMPFNGLLLSVEAKLTHINQHKLGYSFPFQLANCIFAAEPKHWFLKKIINHIVTLIMDGTKIQNNEDIEDMTGPRMLTRLYYQLKYTKDIHILSQIYWMPPLNYPNIWPFNINMYAKHHFHGSWKKTNTKKKSLKQKWNERNRHPNPWSSLLMDLNELENYQ
ncbi:Glycosyltransferase sugar-binding region containing DXD motif protein [Legionella gratiana]|uniref:Glycosyltransferase sugar-binding region containing DXD motif protein n=1 Tax=Legionella gratiana TaxID=45066 RepID=A0A378JG21_9GAMM|nr:glycosyltransferase [Legionella gratiana]KTD12100.1 Glycosyltransferase sugar-binding region containing DXD motif protein [Legionella gratiana]STX46296.1 Mannosyltransferase OCH1 and related enzymes [Legionella gratiana]